MNCKRNLWKKLVTMLLTTALVVTSVYTPLLAAPLEADAVEPVVAQRDDVLDDVTEESFPETEPMILSELEEERDGETKTFLLDNGSRLVAQYGDQIHYEDENGIWQEIDRSLEEEDMGTEEAGYTTTERAGQKERIRFSKKLKEGKTVSIKGTEHPISWGLSKGKKQTVQIETATAGEKKTGNDRFLFVENQRKKVTYPDVYENVDVAYTVHSGGVKEDLILKTAETPHEFENLYEIGKLTPVQIDEQTIALKDGDETVYEIRAPYMEDAKGMRSEDLVLSMEQSKDKKLRVTLTADAQWLGEEERTYPVRIDPTIVTKTTRNDIDSTFITSGKPNANYAEKFELLIGRESSEYDVCRALFRINMPSLGTGDMVVNARLHVVMYDCQFYSSSTPDQQINAHQILADWDQASLTWNTRPTYDGTVLDYAFMGRDDASNNKMQKTFDITEAVKSWYEKGNNYGILVKMEKESGSYAETGAKGYFWPERYNDETGAYPLIEITYRNNKGLEPYWTYTAVDAGKAGTAYINDYTGNLVFVHTDAATTGLLMPFTLQHIYNGYMAGKSYGGNYPITGKGWKLNIQQTLKSSSAYGLTGTSQTTYPYAYEDGDGTVHFFYKKTEDGKTKYYDEDGLGLELKTETGGNTITDKDKNVMTFNSSGNLTSIKDRDGNTLRVTYETAGDGKQKITKVTDGAGHVISFSEYNQTTHYLQKVRDPSGRETVYEYDAGSGYSRLSKITYPGGGSSSYTYDSDGALTRAEYSDGTGLVFTYTSLEKGKRVSRVEELGKDNITGQAMTFDRSKCNTTLIRTSGKDDVHGNNDDLVTTLQFDDHGRTVSDETATADGKNHYGGGVYTYTAGKADVSGSNIRSLNRLSDGAYSVKETNNLLKTHSAEVSGKWTAGHWNGSTSGVTAIRTSGDALYGKYSFKFTSASAVSGIGSCYYQNFADGALEAGKQYTFSAYVKTSGVVGASDSGGACLSVNAGTNFFYSEYVTGTTPGTINEGWRRISLTFQVPESGGEIRTAVLLRNASGTAFFDGMQLESGTVMSSYNLLENSSFENSTNGTTDSWTAEALGSGDGMSVDEHINGGSSFKIEGKASASKEIRQQVNVSGVENDIYIASCWAKAEAVPDAADDERPFEIYARVFYNNGTSSYKKKRARFNRDVMGWQRASMVFNLANNTAGDNLHPEKIEIGIRYHGQENTAYIDHVQLIQDVMQGYTYDQDGNILTVKENGIQSAALTYDDKDNITSVTDALNKSYTYTYDEKGHVTGAVTPMGMKLSFTYNGKGLLNTAKISSAGGTMTLTSATGYTGEVFGVSSGAYTAWEEDYNGYRTSYTTDGQCGEMTAMTDPKGGVTAYTRKETSGVLTGVSSQGSDVTYQYGSGDTRLTSIGHNGFSYSFTYDAFGNVTQVKTAGQVLTTNTYGEKNGKLLSSTYGNGDKSTYEYDRSGAVSQQKINGTTAYSWQYDGGLQPSVYKDYLNERKTAYEYDIAGRLVRTRTTELAGTGNSGEYMSEYAYDARDRTSRSIVTAGGREQTVRYTYNDNGQPEQLIYASNRVQSYSYDALGRLGGKTMSTDAPLEYDYQYYLSKRNGTGETIHKTVQVAKELIGDTGYKYTYDEKGNITKIQEGIRVAGTQTDITGLTEKVSYTYDGKDQLIRENNAWLGKTITYSYDAGGNILSKTIYAYTKAEDLSGVSAQDEIIYGYSGSWKDQMLSYDGSSVSYDAIGNPLSYRGKTLTWTGRRMDTLSGGGVSASYGYDGSGMRVSKTTGGVESSYYYSDGLLSYEKRGDKEFYYTYDHMGVLTGIRYHSSSGSYTMYYVATNIRGDVEAVYKYDGTMEARYIYDSWGKVISVQDGNGNEISNEDHIGNLNPIRYRGYYYDVETGFYYLGSRYYDPEVGRFINADSQLNSSTGLLGYNMFAYCNNNPVMYSDTSGHLPFLAVTAAIGAGIGAIVGGVKAARSGGSVWKGALKGAVIGGALGAGAGALAGAALAGSATAGVTAVGAGAKLFGTYVASGGAGAGATYVANNISRYGKAASTMQQVTQRGKMGEAIANIEKNTKWIPSLSRTATYRIPDGLDYAIGTLSEVKNYTGTLSYTAQLKDFVLYAQAEGLEMHLYTNAKLSGPLQELVNTGVIQLFPLK